MNRGFVDRALLTLGQRRVSRPLRQARKPDFMQARATRARSAGFAFRQIQSTAEAAIRWFHANLPRDYEFGRRSSHIGCGLGLAALTLTLVLPVPARAIQRPDPIPFNPESEAGQSLFAGATFSPDGQTVYVTRYSAFEVDAVKTILVSHRRRHVWSKPEPAPFSGPWSDTTPFVSPDGMRLYFASNRPVNGRTKEDFDIWFVERVNNGWGAPRHESAIASAANETSPSVTKGGVLYFCSWREEGGMGLGDLWRADPLGDGHGPPRNLGSPVNGPTGEWGVTVSPDERLLVFESSGRAEGGSGSGDLYVSRRDGSGWGPPKHLAAPINTSASELSPRFSPDGRTLYFASNRRGRLEMWQVAFSIADALGLAGRP